MQWVFRIGRSRVAVWSALGIGALSASALFGAPQLPAIAGRSDEPDAATESISEAEVVPPAGSSSTTVEEGPRRGVTSDRLSLRSGPATDFDRLAVLSRGRDLSILRREDDWLFVAVGDREGWVHSDFVELEPVSATTTPAVEGDLSILREQTATWQAEHQRLAERVDALERERAELQQALRDIRGEVDFGAAIVPQSLPSERGGWRLPGLGRRSERRQLRQLQERVAALEAERAELARSLKSARSLTVADRGGASPESTSKGAEVGGSSPSDLRLENERLRQELSASEQVRDSLWANIDRLNAELAALRGEVGAVEVEGAATAVSDPSRSAVAERVLAWAASWSAQDPATYLAFYTSDFAPSSGLSRAAWEAQRESRLVRPEFIEVGVDELEIDFDIEGRAVVTFVQAYRSNRYSDRVHKTLRWRRDGGEWRIDSERVRRLP